MKIELVTNQILEVNNARTKIVSIDPEIPSLITTIIIEFIEGPLQGQQRTLRIYNN